VSAAVPAVRRAERRPDAESGPAVPAELVNKVVVAIDVGGTTIKGALVDSLGREALTAVEPTPTGRSGRDAIGVAVDVAERLTRAAGTAGVAATGVVVPGPVDAGSGTALYSANLGWRDLAVRTTFRRRLTAPIVVDNDVLAAALAETTVGAARGVDDALVVVIGTGIAGAAVSGGYLVRGAANGAGEIGHVVVDRSGSVCSCGKAGCLETVASARGIARRYAERRVAGGHPASSAPPLDAAAIVAVTDTDPVAAQVWDDAITALARVLATYVLVVEPTVVVVGGGLSLAGTRLTAPLERALASELGWRPSPRIAVSALAPRGGIAGAAVLAWRRAGLPNFSGWGPRGGAQATEGSGRGVPSRA